LTNGGKNEEFFANALNHFFLKMEKWVLLSGHCFDFRIYYAAVGLLVDRVMGLSDCLPVCHMSYCVVNQKQKGVKN